MSMELKKIGEKDDRILLQSDAGERGWFTFLDLLSFDGGEFAALADKNDEVCVMEFIEGAPGRPETYREIADDRLFETVLERFERQNPELFE